MTEHCTESYLRTKLLADLCFVYKKTGNVFISPQKLKLVLGLINFEMLNVSHADTITAIV